MLLGSHALVWSLFSSPSSRAVSHPILPFHPSASLVDYQHCFLRVTSTSANDVLSFRGESPPSAAGWQSRHCGDTHDAAAAIAARSGHVTLRDSHGGDRRGRRRADCGHGERHGAGGGAYHPLPPRRHHLRRRRLHHIHPGRHRR